MNDLRGKRSLLLGIDCGSTVTKAVLFNGTGNALGTGAIRTPHSTPRPQWVERDMDAMWRDCASAIRQALRTADAVGSDVAAVGVTGHGDGLYLLAADGRPVRPAVLSTDSRAVQTIEELSAVGRTAEILGLTGQVPFPGSTAALLAWTSRYEPQNIDRSRYVIASKDWIKFCLTGIVSTDPTDSSSIGTDVRTQQYSPAAFELLGCPAAADRVPPVVGSAEIAGRITRSAADLTGLAEGTPVVSGLHDIDACAVGTGSFRSRQLTLIAGSYSINETILDEPHLDARWVCRNFVQPGAWMHCSASPASTSNLEWFASEIVCAGESELRDGVFDEIEHEVERALERPREVCFLPFLFGSPISNEASGAFVGLRGWHKRGDLARAVYEGVVLNHVWHVRALESVCSFAEAWLTGGGSKSALWSQMFADAIGVPVSVTNASETGALGAAICAGIGVGRYRDFDQATADLVRVRRTYQPTAVGRASFAEAEAMYVAATGALGAYWSAGRSTS
jgi:L-xylulokinase